MAFYAKYRQIFRPSDQALQPIFPFITVNFSTLSLIHHISIKVKDSSAQETKKNKHLRSFIIYYRTRI